MIAEGVDVRAIWDYDAQPKEWAPCNLCGREHTFSRAGAVDRYGFAQQCDRCPDCGLVFLNPRMTAEAYAEFYASGAYRRLVSAFHGRDVMATIEQEQKEYAEDLIGILDPWTDFWGWETFLDIGGSTGVVAKALARQLSLNATVLDPASEELKRAYMAYDGADGVAYVRLIDSTIEDYDAQGRTWKLVTMCQTADHLLDLMGALKKIKGLLSADGLFWSDIVDFDVTREVKIDHPFNLTERTYRMFLDKAGFKLLQVNYAPDGKHIGFLCKAAA